MMDITNTIKQYQQRIEKLKPHFVMMILDTYIKFDDFEKENERVDKFIQTQKESIEDYEKGRENEKKWVGLIDKYNESKVTQSIQNETHMKSIEIKEQDFLIQEEIPKKIPFNNEFDFNFKSLKINSQSKILSIVNKSDYQKIIQKIDPKYVNYFNINDYNEENSTNMIKICDYNHDNRLIFLDKYNIRFKEEDNDPIITGKINLNSLEKRCDILVNSRYNFIEKTAITISKLIISMKKLAKMKKEKESKIILNKKSDNNINTGHKIDNSVTNSDKFKKIKERNYIDLDKNITTFSKNVNIDKFKNFLDNVKKEIKENDKKTKNQKEETLKMKLKSIKDIINDKKNKNDDLVLYDHNASPNNFHFIEVERNKFDNEDSNPNNRFTVNDNIVMIDEETSNNDRKQRSSSAYRKKNLINFESLISETLRKNEKTIVPKKKVNYVGLKMYLKEELKKKK